MGKNKELHPADQQRKLERKKEKQRNAKQRKETRTNILKQKRPEQIIENLKKLELLEAQGSITGNQAIKEHKHKRKQLLDAYEKCIEMWEEEYKRNPRLLQEGQGPQLGQLPKTRADLEKYLKQQVERQSLRRLIFTTIQCFQFCFHSEFLLYFHFRLVILQRMMLMLMGKLNTTESPIQKRTVTKTIMGTTWSRNPKKRDRKTWHQARHILHHLDLCIRTLLFLLELVTLRLDSVE
eukprot:tig00021350_g20650.t1